MARYRGMVTNNIKFDATIKVRRSIDLRELADFGSITDAAQDLPTSGATHRRATGGSTSATRGLQIRFVSFTSISKRSLEQSSNERSI